MLPGKRGENKRPHLVPDAATRSQHHGIAAAVAEKLGELVGAFDRSNHHGEIFRRIDQQRVPR